MTQEDQDKRERVSWAVSRLKALGLRATPQRIAIVAFLKGNTTHPSAEDIYEAVSPTMPSLSLGTVYSTLDELIARGEIQQLAIDPERKHLDPNPVPHHHFLCEKCRRIYDYPGSFPTPKNEGGFTIKSCAVHLYGVCPACKKDP